MDSPYTGLAEVYDDVVVDPVYADWARFLQRAWGEDVSTVLDVGCGTGLLDEQLLALGYFVSGVDASLAMLAKAQRRLGDRVTLMHSELPDIALDGPFDACVSTFDTLNYLDPSQFTQSLRSISERLRPGGWFVCDLHTDAMLQTVAEQPESAGEQAGHRFTLHSAVDLKARTCDTIVEIVNDDSGDQVVERHRQFFHTDHDVQAALRSHGFTEIRCTHEYTDAQVDATTLRATWIARRT